MFEVAEAYDETMGDGAGSWRRYSWSLSMFGMVRMCLMLAAALAPCQRHWPESPGLEDRRASILRGDPSITLERKLPSHE